MDSYQYIFVMQNLTKAPKSAFWALTVPASQRC